MKYIKTYEFNGLNYNDIYKFIKKIIKIVDEKYSIYLTGSNVICISYKVVPDEFTEQISRISFQTYAVIFEIYNPKYELNILLREYFTSIMEKMYDKNYHYTFSYKSNTKLKIKDFKSLINANKYNL
jgi:hypothetical protein